MKVLLVDTDRALVEMLTSWLKTLGYEVHPAYSAQQAKLKWIEHHPDLVVLESAIQDEQRRVLCHPLELSLEGRVLVVGVTNAVLAAILCFGAAVGHHTRDPLS